MPTAAETDATVSAPSPASPVPVGEAESPKKKCRVGYGWL